jgi:hypothetical protein
MATVIARVQDYQVFWRQIVEPDYKDFMAKIDDLRRAFHCAITLFHMSDWIYVSQKTYINANFTFKDKNGISRPVTCEKKFANAVGDLHPDFDLIRGIANSAKHLVLGHRRVHSHLSMANS